MKITNSLTPLTWPLALLVLLSLQGCLSDSSSGTDSGSGGSGGDDKDYTGYLVQVESDQEFEALLKSSVSESSRPEAGTDAPVGTDESDRISGEDDFSGTTLIEAGVDEMDLVKFDGDVIYQVYQNTGARNAVRLLEVADDGSTSVASTIELDNTTAAGLMIDGGELTERAIQGLYLYRNGDQTRLVIMSQQSQYWTTPCDDAAEVCILERSAPVYFDSSYHFVDVYDVSDAATPEPVYTRRFNGNLQHTRRVEGAVYTISSLVFGLRNYDYSSDDSAAQESNKALLDDIPITDFLPPFKDETGADNTWFTSRDCYIPQGVEAVSRQLHLSVISRTDLVTGEINANCVLSYTDNFYASTEAIYFTEGFDWQSQNSRIHKFALATTGVDYRGSSTVIGRITGDFNMSEKDGLLRVVSSKLANTPEPLEDGQTDLFENVDEEQFEEVPGARHYLSVFSESQTSDALELVSRIPNQNDDRHIGKPGEDVYGVRFMGDRAYVVTFLRTDPFYTIDLSDPFEPRVRGELEIPGFSTQLFPINDSYVLGIGQENGLKLDLYDVTDLDAPERRDQYVFGESFYSPALNDHHSVTMLYDSDNNEMKLALPAYSWNSDAPTAGLHLFDLDGLNGQIEANGQLDTTRDELDVQWNDGFNTRAIIDGEQFHYVTPKPVYSADWDEPENPQTTP